MSRKQPTQDVSVDSLMAMGLDGLGEYIRDAREMLKANPGDSDRAATLANVLTKVATVQGEQRKADAAQRKADAEWSREAMLERLRRMPDSERRACAQAAGAMVADAKKSGLA